MNNDQRSVNDKKNILRDKSYSFALKIIEIYKIISEKRKEYVLTKQLLRAGTSIGAMIRESEYAQSKADFINKLSVALKEANETEYWISLLYDSGYLDKKTYDELRNACIEIMKILTASIKTAKNSE